MKSCAGITQHVEIAEEYIEKTYELHKELIFVGPFETSVEASSWLAYVVGRSNKTRAISLPCNCIDSSPWYGVTFECRKERDNNWTSKEQFPEFNGH